MTSIILWYKIYNKCSCLIYFCNRVYNFYNAKYIFAKYIQPDFRIMVVKNIIIYLNVFVFDNIWVIVFSCFFFVTNLLNIIIIIFDMMYLILTQAAQVFHLVIHKISNMFTNKIFFIFMKNWLLIRYKVQTFIWL